MEKLHYHYRADALFGKNGPWNHRTLRTFFDPFSSEWRETTRERKLEVLEKLVASDYPLADWLADYENYYRHESVGRAYVIKEIDSALQYYALYANGETAVVIADLLKQRQQTTLQLGDISIGD